MTTRVITWVGRCGGAGPLWGQVAGVGDDVHRVRDLPYRLGPTGRSIPLVLLLAVALGEMASPAVGQPAPRDEPPPGVAEGRMEGAGPGPVDEGRPGMGRHRPGPPPGLWFRMSPPERSAIVAFAEEHFPRMFLELERLRTQNPRRFERRMSRVAPEIRQMMELMETHPERGSLRVQERQLDIQMRHLARRHHAVKNNEKREKLRGDLAELCGKAFDCRHQRRAIEIRELEARIAELKQRHEEAARMRTQLIEREVKRRLDGPPEPLPPPAEPPDQGGRDG